MVEATFAAIQTGLMGNIPCGRTDCGAILANVKALAAHLHIHNIHESNVYVVIGDSDSSTIDTHRFICRTYVCVGCNARFEDKVDADEHRRNCAWVIRDCSSPPPQVASPEGSKNSPLFSLIY